MAKLNLKSMTVSELVALRNQVSAAISEKVGSERAELQKRIDALNSLDGGSSTGDMGSAPRRRGRPPKATEFAKAPTRRSAAKGKKVEPKYSGPAGETWTGRGLPPRWLAALEAEGKKRENYLIKK